MLKHRNPFPRAEFIHHLLLAAAKVYKLKKVEPHKTKRLKTAKNYKFKGLLALFIDKAVSYCVIRKKNKSKTGVLKMMPALMR